MIKSWKEGKGPEKEKKAGQQRAGGVFLGSLAHAQTWTQMHDVHALSMKPPHGLSGSSKSLLTQEIPSAKNIKLSAIRSLLVQSTSCMPGLLWALGIQRQIKHRPCSGQFTLSTMV